MTGSAQWQGNERTVGPGRRFAPARIVALAVIGVLILGLGFLRFAPAGGAVSVPAGAHAGDLTLKPCSYATETGTGQPQISTNFELYRHPTPEEMPDGPLTAETNAFWRYRTLAARIAAHRGPFTPDDLKENNACVNSGTMFRVVNADPAQRGIAAGSLVRTLWHSLYDVNAGAAEFSFYLGDDADAEGGRSERRSEYVRFALAGE